MVHTTRGGQVTYHGPGQLIAYPLLDLHRRALGIRQLVTLLEQSMVSVLAEFGIAAFSISDAPGVYVARDFASGGSGGSGNEVRKIGSIGLRVTRGRSYHGMALNVAMDLAPFSRINPCGLVGMRMTQVSDLAASPVSLDEVGRKLAVTLASRLGETASSYAH